MRNIFLIFLFHWIVFQGHTAHAMAVYSRNMFDVRKHTFFMLQGRQAASDRAFEQGDGDLYGVVCAPGAWKITEPPHYIYELSLFKGRGPIPRGTCSIALHIPQKHIKLFYSGIFSFYKNNLTSNYRGAKPIDNLLFMQNSFAVATGLFTFLSAWGILKQTLYDPISQKKISDGYAYSLLISTIYLMIWIYSVYIGDIPLHKAQGQKNLYGLFHASLTQSLDAVEQPDTALAGFLNEQTDKNEAKTFTVNRIFCDFFNRNQKSITRLEPYEDILDEVQTNFDNDSSDLLQQALGEI